MTDSSPLDSEFLNQLTATIEKNLANEQFGVSELADALSMSRSNLLRKVKKATNLSVSQLISQVRLKRGMDLLRSGSHNVSEVAHQVGFNSTSYFIKCFREYYGYPPGEVGKRNINQEPIPVALPPSNNKKPQLIIVAILSIAAVVAVWFLYPRLVKQETIVNEKSMKIVK